MVIDKTDSKWSIIVYVFVVGESADWYTLKQT